MLKHDDDTPLFDRIGLDQSYDDYRKAARLSMAGQPIPVDVTARLLGNGIDPEAIQKHFAA